MKPLPNTTPTIKGAISLTSFPAPGAWCFAGMKKLLTIVLCAAVAVMAGSCTKDPEVEALKANIKALKLQAEKEDLKAELMELSVKTGVFFRGQLEERYGLQAQPAVRKIMFWTIDNRYSTTHYPIIP